MKNKVINIRIPSTFKDDLEILSKLKGLNLSDLGRKALNEYYNTAQVEGYTNESNLEKASNSDRDELLQSLAFAELVFWVYEKKNNPEMYEIDMFYEQHLALIKEMNGHPRFDSIILKEFNKIKVEIEEKVFGNKNDSDQFTFPKDNHSNSFNYGLLADFMYNIRYTKDQNQDLFIK